MAIILCLETTTKNCSVAIFENGILLQLKEQNSANFSHAELLTFFIKQVLESTNITFKQLDAIAISKGPGSYTGLRIGTSTAKGLCYSLEIPLISISTLKAMALVISEKYKSSFYCPMIDARRMEVFAGIFDNENNEIRQIKADIVTNETYKEYLNKKILFFGDGANKCKEAINHKNAKFIEGIYPSAKNLGSLSYKNFLNREFEDVAYFVPYYLKDFITGKKS